MVEALRRVAVQAPQYERRIFLGERLLVVLVLNGRHLAPSRVAETSLTDGDRLDVLPPVAGG